MPNSERIPVLVTPEQKAKIVAGARAANLPVGEFMRRAAQSFSPADQDESALSGLVTQVLQSTQRAEKSLDRVIREVKASERRIAGMEVSRSKRRGRKLT